MIGSRESGVLGKGHKGSASGLFAMAFAVALSMLAGQTSAQDKGLLASAPTVNPASYSLELAQAPASTTPATTAQPMPSSLEFRSEPVKEIRGGDTGLEPVPEWTKPVPLGILVEYSLLSDYICRKGLNLSEYPGEGREKPNHQLLVVPSLPTKDLFGKGTDYGTFAFPMWFEWYAGQHHLSPWDSSDFQEADFMPTWSYAIPKTPLTFSLTYDGYTLPRLKDLPGGGCNSFGQEVWFGLALDDSAIFGKPVLSPHILYVKDIDHNGGGWIDIGINHDFKLSEMGLKDAAVLKDVTLTPGIVFGIDNRYDDKIVGNPRGTHFSTINYGLTTTYDLNGAFKIPAKYGSFYVKTFLNYKQQVHDYHVQGALPVLRDELYGGVAFGYGW